VGYPILHLSRHREDVHWYLRQIEEALIVSLHPFGIEAGRNPGYTGVWTGGRKIASIGIHVKRWVTLHGFALNVTTDLSVFDVVVPCGIQGVVMTSIEAEGRRHGVADRPLWSRSLDTVTSAFAEVFRLEPTPWSTDEAQRVSQLTAHGT
jgi:lipoyl(octanoyl) transferase